MSRSETSFKKVSLDSDLIQFVNVFPHVYSPGGGAETFADKILMSTERPCNFVHLLQFSIKISLKSDFIHIFACYTCIAPGLEQTAPWCQNFYFNISFSSLWSFVVSFFL